MGDGHLDYRFTCKFIGQEKDLQTLREIIHQVFSIENKRMTIIFRKNIGESYLLQVNDALFGRLLSILGAPIGNKTEIPFLVPRWISENKKFTRYFLQGLFEDELATIKIKREKYIREATFRMAKIEKYQPDLLQFLSQIKEMTESFSVKCSEIGEPYFENEHRDGNKTFSRCFRILGNRQNIIKFNEEIGFLSNSMKINELNKCLEMIK